MSGERNNRGQRYEEYHEQFGNLTATGYAMAVDEAGGALQQGTGAIRRILAVFAERVGSAGRHALPSTRPQQHGATAR